MVLHHSNSFVALVVVLASLALTPTALAQESNSQMLAQNSATRAASASVSAKSKGKGLRLGQRWGVGLVTIPQTAYLRSSLGYDAEILTVSSGVSLSYDIETRSNRFIYYAAAGVSVLGVKASSMSETISYSYGESNYINYMAGLGAYYITESMVRFGVGLRSLYGSYTLPQPETPGVSYTFNYGSPFKNYMSLDLNWQLTSGWIFGQTMLHPLSQDLATGWQLSLKKRF